MSFLARVSYTADGSTDTFSFSFPYILSSHVKVYVDGVEDTGVTFPTTSTVQLSSTPANGAVVLIQRTTPSDARLVDFQDGSVLTSADLDQSADQNFYIAQETTDNVASKLGEDASGRYDANNKRIINVANPVDTQDAVTKNYLENTWLSTANKTALTTVNANIANINAVNSNEANINSVNSNETNINTVATNIGSVNTVATDINKVIAVANDLAEAVSEVETVADDLNEATSEIDTVATNIANVNLVGNDIANVNTLAGLNTEITNLNNIRTDITGVNTISADVTAVNNIAPAITTVNNNSANINAVNANSVNINAVKTNEANINAVNANSANINTVAGLDTEITALGASGTVASINTVATNINSVNSFANTYLGASATPPTQDPDGSSLDLGDLYFDSASDTMKVYSSGGWINAGSAVNGTANRFKYTATASQTTFSGADDNSETLAFDPPYLDVFLNGVKLVNTADFTATSGTSIVLASGASANDILEVIAYGTFTLSNFSITDANDVPVLGSAGQALVVNSAGTSLEFANASSAEVYGFNKDSNGNLIVTTTNQGQDNISSTDFANFDDVLFSASGFTFSISNGELIATI